MNIVILYHSTDEAGKVGIEAAGFKGTYSPSGSDLVYFVAWKDTGLTSWRRDWWVIVEIPDEFVVADPDGVSSNPRVSSIYTVPASVVNRYRESFRYERWTAAEKAAGGR